MGVRSSYPPLDPRGTSVSTQVIAARLEAWQREQPQVAMLIGGPDGLSDAWRARARETWSLSGLTLPHGLVRVLIAEQIYRAWSLLAGHPYHRG